MARTSAVKVIPAGLVKRLHVDRRIVAQNVKRDENKPAITIQTSKGPIKAHTVWIRGPSLFKQSMDKPLSCGARLWVETHAEVVLT